MTNVVVKSNCQNGTSLVMAKNAPKQKYVSSRIYAEKLVVSVGTFGALFGSFLHTEVYEKRRVDLDMHGPAQKSLR